MENLKIYSNSKVNIHLDIINKNKDSYHNLFMINQNVDIYDIIYLKKNYNRLNFETNEKSIQNEDNIIIKTIKLLESYFNIKILVSIKLEKNIPMKAGLGGGSGNCAAILQAIIKLYNLKISEEDLIGIAKSLGADVPFFLKGGTSIISGIGEKIIPISSEKFYYVIIKPEFSIETRAAYRDYDKSNAKKVSKFNERDYNPNLTLNKNFIENYCFNSFDILYNEIYNLNTYKNDLLNSGAFFAQMTGSGSAIFGMFDSEKIQKESYQILKNKYENIFICETQSRANIIETF